MKRKRQFAGMTLIAILSLGVYSFCSPSTAEPKADAFPYALSAARVINLPASLNEISGIGFNLKTGGLYAVEDETGTLYQISLNGGNEVTGTSFGKGGDYEDLALVKNTIYVLQSNGDIVSFPAENPGKIATFSIPLRGKNDFESLLYMPGSERLLIFCKACKGGKKGEETVWQFDLKAGTYSQAAFSFRWPDGKGMGGKGLQPSAAAVHPKTGDLYFLSSVQKMLIVTDKNGAVKSSQSLDGKLYNQPEGICFLPTGELAISNEKGTKGAATLLIASPIK